MFGDSAQFDDAFENQPTEDMTEEEKRKETRPSYPRITSIVESILLRRVKADVEKSLLPKIETNVYIGMTDMQVDWYKRLLEKDIDAVNGVVGNVRVKQDF